MTPEEKKTEVEEGPGGEEEEDEQPEPEQNKYLGEHSRVTGQADLLSDDVTGQKTEEAGGLRPPSTAVLVPLAGRRPEIED